ncbi:MAG: phosphoribosyltransferase family protein [Oscillospiraceae bacterium]
MPSYEIDIAGLTRELPVCHVSEDNYIGAFILFGDVELTVHCASELLKLAPDFDFMLGAEAKSIPLLYEMARQSGENEYIIAHKNPKLYMSGSMEVEVKSITTPGVQRLVLDMADAELLRGARILIVDDVISTGETAAALEKLVEKAGGTVAGRMFILAEGEAQKREDIIFLAPLPLLDPSGNPQ